jgi:hypothetical protein
MAAKPIIQSTRRLTRRDSRALVRSVTSVTLTDERREQLRRYAADLQKAFAAPLPHGVRRG